MTKKAKSLFQRLEIDITEFQIDLNDFLFISGWNTPHSFSGLLTSPFLLLSSFFNGGN